MATEDRATGEPSVVPRSRELLSQDDKRIIAIEDTIFKLVCIIISKNLMQIEEETSISPKRKYLNFSCQENVPWKAIQAIDDFFVFENFFGKYSGSFLFEKVIDLDNQPSSRDKRRFCPGFNGPVE